MTVYARDARVLWRRSGTRCLLLTPGDEEPLLLDGVGAVVWELLAEPAERDDLLGALSEVFATDPATVDLEVTRFLDELIARRAVARR